MNGNVLHITSLKLPSVMLADNSAKAPTTIQVARCGDFYSEEKGNFSITPADLLMMVRNFDEQQNDVVIDFEHQTYSTSFNGQPAPAMGWIKELSIVGDALYAGVEWTPDGEEMVKGKAYRYISPTICYDTMDNETGARVGTVLHSAALTNVPFLDGMKPIMNKDQKKLNTNEEEKAMKEQLEAAQKALAESQAHTAELEKQLTEIRTAMEQAAKDSEATKTAAEAVTAENVQLKEFKKTADANALVLSAIEQGKIAPAQKEWANQFALKDSTGFTEWMKSAPKVVPLKETMTTGGDAQHKEPTYADLLKQPDKMIELSNNDPEKFKRLREEFFQNKK